MQVNGWSQAGMDGNRGGPARDCRDADGKRKRLHHQVLGPSVRFTRLSLSHPPDAPSTAPHLGLQYYLQSADCLLSNPTPSAHHPRPRLPFVRPLFVKRITLPLSSTITPRHALCTPFHRPAFTALVRINLVTSTGPQRQQQERHTPTHRHTEREQSISYEIFHLATSNIKHHPKISATEAYATLDTPLSSTHATSGIPARQQQALPIWNTHWSALGHLDTLK